MGRNRKSIVVALVMVLTAGATWAGVALATPPSGLVGTLLGRGTTSLPIKYTIPKVVTVTVKVRVKVKGKYVTRKKTVQRTIDSPVISCSDSSPCDVVQQKLVSAPGIGSSGWHSHPGLALVVVTTGTVNKYGADCKKETYAAGQTIVELGRDDVSLVRNEGSTPAELLVTFIVPAGTANADLRIDQPAPANCSP